MLEILGFFSFSISILFFEKKPITTQQNAATSNIIHTHTRSGSFLNSIYMVAFRFLHFFHHYRILLLYIPSTNIHVCVALDSREKKDFLNSIAFFAGLHFNASKIFTILTTFFVLYFFASFVCWIQYQCRLSC